MQRWDRIEAFVEVVRLGTFSAAARHLKVSTSHISRLVSQLENQLGVQLLYRTTRQIRLTDAGALYAEHCRHLFDGLRDAEQAISELQAKPHGLLKLTSATTFGERYVAPLVNDFQRLHPQLEVHMHFTNRPVELIEEGFDIAIRMGVLKDSSLIARRLCGRREYVVGSQAYFRQAPRPHTLGELSQHRCLLGSRPNWLFEVHGQRREVKVEGCWSSNQRAGARPAAGLLRGALSGQWRVSVGAGAVPTPRHGGVGGLPAPPPLIAQDSSVGRPFGRPYRHSVTRSLAFDGIDCETTFRGLFVLILHIATGIAHGADHLIQRDKVVAVTV